MQHAGIRFSEELVSEKLDLPGDAVIIGVEWQPAIRAVVFWLRARDGREPSELEIGTCHTRLKVTGDS
jgi:hypothetical protein